MEDHHHHHQGQDPNSPSNGSDKSNSSSAEPAVRSRWTPRPEQIVILESIFNSGMVNPPKDETVRIRKLLEKFGAVGDVNVFYWFQNRRSRSRRRQRQMQASLEVQQQQQQQQQQRQQQNLAQAAGGASQYESNYNSDNTTQAVASYVSGSASFVYSPSSYNNLLGSSSSSPSRGVLADHHHGVDYNTNFFQVSGQMGFPQIEQSTPVTSVLYPPDSPNMHFLSGFITVFINGVPTEVPKGLIDMKPVFGQDVILVHSSGLPLPTNEYGILLQSLQPGESYFLVPRPTYFSGT